MLVDREIEKLGDTLIHPFSKENLGCVSYDLTIEGFVESNGLENSITLLPNQMAMVKTVESLTMPTNLVATIGGKNSRIRQGIEVTAPKYFPGHKTSIYLRVYNCSPYEIKLSKGEKIAQIFFEELGQTPEVPYSVNETASYNNETNYMEYGNYSSAYKKQMKLLKDAEEDLKNKENTMYANILTLMGIFVAVISLLVVNLSNVANFTVNDLVKINISLGIAISLFLGVLLYFINKRK